MKTLVALLGCGLVAFAIGCGEEGGKPIATPTTPTGMDPKYMETMQKSANAAKEAGDTVKEAANDATEAVKETAKDAVDATKGKDAPVWLGIDQQWIVPTREKADQQCIQAVSKD